MGSIPPLQRRHHRALITLIKDDEIKLLISKKVLQQLHLLLNQEQLSPFLNQNIINDFLHLIIEHSTIIKPPKQHHLVLKSQNQALADLAIAGKAQCLIHAPGNFPEFSQLDGYKLINVIELETFIKNY